MFDADFFITQVMVWKYSNPQHFNTPGGMYEWGGGPDLKKANPNASSHRTKHEFCVQIRDFQEARRRNVVAENALRLTKHGSVDGVWDAYMNASWLDVAQQHNLHQRRAVVRSADNHLRPDCTHFCSTPPLLDLWVDDFFTELLRVPKVSVKLSLPESPRRVSAYSGRRPRRRQPVISNWLGA